jgi:hypothetical protein
LGKSEADRGTIHGEVYAVGQKVISEGCGDGRRGHFEYRVGVFFKVGFCCFPQVSADEAISLVELEEVGDGGAGGLRSISFGVEVMPTSPCGGIHMVLESFGYWYTGKSFLGGPRADVGSHCKKKVGGGGASVRGGLGAKALSVGSTSGVVYTRNEKKKNKLRRLSCVIDKEW